MQTDYLIMVIPPYLSNCTFSEYDEVHVLNNFDEDIDVDIFCRDIAGNKKLHGIIAMHERDLIRADKLRLLFKAKQYSLGAFGIIFRNKVVMKSWLVNNNIEVPAFCLPEHPQDILAFIANNNFPLIVKPIYGSSSIGIQKLMNLEEVKDFFASYYIKDIGFLPDSGMSYLFEQCIEEGDLLHADGIIDQNSLSLVEVAAYFHGCHEYRDGMDTGSYLLPKKDKRCIKIIEVLSHVASKLHNQHYVFHAEFFSVGSKLYVCEIALRPAGAMVPRMIQAKTGVDLRTFFLQMQTGNFINNGHYKLQTGLFAWLAVPKPKEPMILEKVPDKPLFPFIVDYDLQAKEIGNVYQDNIKTFDYAVAVIFSGQSSREIMENRAKILHWYSENITWRKAC